MPRSRPPQSGIDNASPILHLRLYWLCSRYTQESLLDNFLHILPVQYSTADCSNERSKTAIHPPAVSYILSEKKPKIRFFGVLSCFCVRGNRDVQISLNVQKLLFSALTKIHPLYFRNTHYIQVFFFRLIVATRQNV